MLGHVRQVGLREHHYLRDVAQRLRVDRKFMVDRHEFRNSVLALAVDEVEQQSATLRVAQEGKPQALARRGALDQPRDVEPHHRPAPKPEALHLAHTQIRDERGERIVSDLGTRARDRP